MLSSLIWGNLLALVFLSFSARIQDLNLNEAPCDLLVPAPLKPLEMTDSCLFPSFLPEEKRTAVVLSPGQGEKIFLRSMDVSLYEYPEGAEPVILRDGRVFLIHHAVPPVAAMDSRGDIVTEELRKRDGTAWGGGFMDVLRHENGWINLQFRRPDGASEAMLLCEGGASPRAEEAITSHILEGKKSAEDLEKNRTFIRAMRKWMWEELALHVMIWNGRDWRDEGSSLPWVSTRRVGFLLSLKGIPYGDVKIRIQAPSALWTLDRAAVEYDPEGPLRASYRTRILGKDIIVKTQEKALDIPPVTAGKTRAARLLVKGYYQREVYQWMP